MVGQGTPELCAGAAAIGIVEGEHLEAQGLELLGTGHCGVDVLVHLRLGKGVGNGGAGVENLDGGLLHRRNGFLKGAAEHIGHTAGAACTGAATRASGTARTAWTTRATRPAGATGSSRAVLFIALGHHHGLGAHTLLLSAGKGGVGAGDGNGAIVADGVDHLT